MYKLFILIANLLLIKIIESRLFVSVKYLKDQEFMDKFGRRLKKVRESKEITQEQLAYLTEIVQSQIARTELGQINTSISHVSVYAKALNVHPSTLFDFTDL
jgi:ribosome-binding protein aMBF1 (putative translation factor)